jgi:hypothetical protein
MGGTGQKQKTGSLCRSPTATFAAKRKTQNKWISGANAQAAPPALFPQQQRRQELEKVARLRIGHDAREEGVH